MLAMMTVSLLPLATLGNATQIWLWPVLQTIYDCHMTTIMSDACTINKCCLQPHLQWQKFLVKMSQMATVPLLALATLGNTTKLLLWPVLQIFYDCHMTIIMSDACTISKYC